VYKRQMVPKRWAKRAVTRNTIKRQIYNACSACGQDMPVAAYVIRLRSGFDRKQFVSATSAALKQAVGAELQQLLTRVCVRRSPRVSATNHTLDS
jgi:ribonuclease P protein component